MTILGEITTLVTSLCTALIILIFVRIAMLWFPRVLSQHPVRNGTSSIVDPILSPLRRLLPPVMGMDMSPLLAIVLLSVLAQVVGAIGINGLSATGIVTLIVSMVLHAILEIAMILLLVRMVLQLFAPDSTHPLALFVYAATDRLVEPFHKGPRFRRSLWPSCIALVVVFAIDLAVTFLLK